MFGLDEPTILEWWEECQKRLPPRTNQIGSKLFMYMKITVIEIPNKACYNYLAACGYRCNRNGEMLLSVKEYDEYISFQKMMLEGK
jgi:hypothetical protein